MAPPKAAVKSRPASRSRPAAKNNFRDEEVILLWKVAKLNYKEVRPFHPQLDWLIHVLNSNFLQGDIAALAKELNLSVGAARMRWSRLKTKIDAFEKKATGNETTTATADPVDTTMEDTKGAEETDESQGGNNDEDAKWASWQLLFMSPSVERSEETFRVVSRSSKLQQRIFWRLKMRMIREYT